MSHIVQIQTEVRDPVAIGLACQRQHWPAPVTGIHRLFLTEVTGLAVHLPGWKYPVVCTPASGALQYDHYEGRWGDPAQLGLFLQAYAVEKARLEARRRGHSVAEQTLPDGSIRLTIQTGGHE